MDKLTICIVDDEETIRLSLGRLFAGRGHQTLSAATGAEALALAEQHTPDVFLLDLMLPDIDGIEVLRQLKALNSDSAVIMISAHGNIEKAVEAVKQGAENFVSKPIDVRKLEALVETVGKYIRAERQVEYYRRRLQKTGKQFIGVSTHTQQVLQLIDLMAENADTTVLLSGESGTGKGVVAELIHERSRRSARPFVDISCAELTLPLLESELFGHERGAFTDAKQLKKGLMEVANGGTVFLDEIGELDPILQPKLLKILENRVFRRVGGITDIRVDVRIIAATNVDLEAKLENGTFREDLYYRLKVMPMHLLPLRERRDDIVPLVEHFLAGGNPSMVHRGRGITQEALGFLERYSWPGNIRELRNVLERAMILARGAMISPDELPPEILGATRPPIDGPHQTLKQMERDVIANTLETCGGNRTRTAQSLGISRSTLLEKLKRYELG